MPFVLYHRLTMDETAEMNETIRTLKQIVECPVCLQILRPEMVTCINGHVICRECRGDQKVCPSCGKDFSKDVQRLTLVQQVVEAIPRQCRFTSCEKIFRGHDHEEHCVFKPTSSKWSDCAWERSWMDLATHFLRHRRFICNIGGFTFFSDDIFETNKYYMGTSVELSCAIEMVYDPKKETTFTIYPKNRNHTKFTFKFLISLEDTESDMKALFHKKVKFDDTLDKEIVISSLMFCQFMEHESFKLSIDITMFTT